MGSELESASSALSNSSATKELSLPWRCRGEENVFSVKTVEGIVTVNSTKELGGNQFTWRFQPSESVLIGIDMYWIFSQFNFIHKPTHFLEEDVLLFCQDFAEEESCHILNASHPPDTNDRPWWMNFQPSN